MSNGTQLYKRKTAFEPVIRQVEWQLDELNRKSVVSKNNIDEMERQIQGKQGMVSDYEQNIREITESDSEDISIQLYTLLMQNIYQLLKQLEAMQVEYKELKASYRKEIEELIKLNNKLNVLQDKHEERLDDIDQGRISKEIKEADDVWLQSHWGAS